MPFDGQEFTNDTIRALEKARAYMDEHGWCRHVMADGDGHVCLIGAVDRALDQAVSSLWFAANGALGEAIRKRGCRVSVHVYNDCRLQSKAEALSVFDEAIALERQKLMEKTNAL